MVVKRGAALAAGLVVVAGLLGGCAQKPGVAATTTPMSCGKAEAPPVYEKAADGTVSWSCPDGAVVRGESVTISNTEAADYVAQAEEGGAYLTGAEAIGDLISLQVLVRVADQHGVTVSDDAATQWLDDQGFEKNDAMMLFAKARLLSEENLTGEQIEAINAELLDAVCFDQGGTVHCGLDVDVNPRFGTFDPEKQIAAADEGQLLFVFAPAWLSASPL